MLLLWNPGPRVVIFSAWRFFSPPPSFSGALVLGRGNSFKKYLHGASETILIFPVGIPLSMTKIMPSLLSDVDCSFNSLFILWPYNHPPNRQSDCPAMMGVGLHWWSGSWKQARNPRLWLYCIRTQNTSGSFFLVDIPVFFPYIPPTGHGAGTQERAYREPIQAKREPTRMKRRQHNEGLNLEQLTELLYNRATPSSWNTRGI